MKVMDEAALRRAFEACVGVPAYRLAKRATSGLYCDSAIEYQWFGFRTAYNHFANEHTKAMLTNPNAKIDDMLRDLSDRLKSIEVKVAALEGRKANAKYLAVTTSPEGTEREWWAKVYGDTEMWRRISPATYANAILDGVKPVPWPANWVCTPISTEATED